jgi:hypothetical protein
VGLHGRVLLACDHFDRMQWRSDRGATGLLARLGPDAGLWDFYACNGPVLPDPRRDHLILGETIRYLDGAVGLLSRPTNFVLEVVVSSDIGASSLRNFARLSE